MPSCRRAVVQSCRRAVRACGTSLVRWMALQCAKRTARRLRADLSDRWTYGGQRSHAIGWKLEVCVVLPSSDRWQQCVREAPLHAYSVDGTTTLIGRCPRERSVLLNLLLVIIMYHTHAIFPICVVHQHDLMLYSYWSTCHSYLYVTTKLFCMLLCTRTTYSSHGSTHRSTHLQGSHTYIHIYNG